MVTYKCIQNFARHNYVISKSIDKNNPHTITWTASPHSIFTARRYAKRGICRRRVSVCLSVCVCVCACLAHSGIVSKRLNVGSRK